jgi:flagellar basal-body rod protein FlgG
MIKGLYSSASGMVPSVRKQELHANNIANAKTTGFKKDVQFNRELNKAEAKHQLKKDDWQLPLVDQDFVDFSSGTFDKTGNPLDLAIEGDGFFVLLDDEGNQYLSRAGMFEVSNDGLLQFPGGLTLQGASGPIEVGRGELSVSQSGEVQVNGITVNQITPQTVSDLGLLEKAGSSLFRVPDGVELINSSQPVVRQGYLEAANLNIVEEMVDMIITYRMYEANAKALQSQDDSLEQLFGKVGGK